MLLTAPSTGWPYKSPDLFGNLSLLCQGVIESQKRLKTCTFQNPSTEQSKRKSLAMVIICVGDR